MKEQRASRTDQNKITNIFTKKTWMLQWLENDFSLVADRYILIVLTEC